MLWIRRFLILSFLIVTFSAAIGVYWAWTSFEYKNPETQLVYFKKGSSVRSIAQTLEETGVVQNAWIFEVYVRLFDKAQKLKAGEYEFENGVSLQNVADKIAAGQVKLYQFTIPEGLNIQGVCEILSKKSLMTMSECEALVHNVDLLKEPPPVKTLEGYLFPETYSYDRESTPQAVIKSLVDMFYAKTKELEPIIKEQNLKLHDVVILASVIEKETGAPQERPLISGVFHNRLKIGMPLQSDPTTIYGLKNFNGNLTRADLKTDHPYNTYTRQGLPIGPIANPGLAALRAVLQPARTRALYFVAKGNGTHYFSETLDEHNDAVRYYQLKSGPPPQGTPQL